MSKKDKKQEQQHKEQIEKVEQEKVNKEVEFLKRINELEKQLIEQQVSIIEKDKQLTELRAQVKSLNDERVAKAKQIASEAQVQIDKKLKEYQDKFENEAKENKKYALSSSILEFISILNQLDIAINQPVSDPKVQNYLNGLKMFINMLKHCLKSNHVV